MVCIVAFFVVLVASAVSAKYRKLLGRAWSCAWRRVTLRPCDASFGDDVKNQMLAPLALRAPRLVRPASITIDVLAWITVLSLVVSLFIVGKSGLNLAVYGTCDKQNAEACSLSAQACGVGSEVPGFWESIGRGDVIGAFGNEFASVADTIQAIPSRLKTWDAAEYAPETATYLGGYRAGLPLALEVLDPGCRYCAELFRNLEESGFVETHNLTYIAYPIETWNIPKFPHSPLVARYLTAVQVMEQGAGGSGSTPDWHILEQIFAGERPDGTSWQVWLNEEATAEEAEEQLQTWLAEAGYDDARVAEAALLADSDEVAAIMADARVVVEDDIRTVSIPAFIADGRLHAGVVSVDALERMR